MPQNLDALDRAIVAALLEDGRLSQVQLSERIPLSPTAIARRIRALEQGGIIQGYQARIDRKAMGLEITVHVFISLQNQSEQQLESFETAVLAAPSVIRCQMMSGEDDYLLTVHARDLSDFERIHKQELSRLPGVTRLRSSFVLRDVKSRPIPASVLLGT
ncbi:Lrp/AsnC family transcriptional regulator [Hyphomicrobium sp. LHD-15]|uniref:Lrp/AsnC family transcriptional regulator n=1 Tax=Hyphomicrobium sp. LHD-15 TaxID=3072142 RepID=UPI0028104A46|nr:Lrp/AsnC family transcriptional regulator [Hyphomicrobium sp. LHD-15]MDQ8699664.1 Lrp/AsnC family transcriptional regulator [Hyphomicrobium sp. LHD-15]